MRQQDAVPGPDDGTQHPDSGYRTHSRSPDERFKLSQHPQETDDQQAGHSHEPKQSMNCKIPSRFIRKGAKFSSPAGDAKHDPGNNDRDPEGQHP